MFSHQENTWFPALFPEATIYSKNKDTGTI